MNDLIDSRIGSGSPLTEQQCKTHYWEFATNLTTEQWRALQFLIVSKETSPDTTVNNILGEYLDKVEVPTGFNEAEWQE